MLSQFLAKRRSEGTSLEVDDIEITILHKLHDRPRSDADGGICLGRYGLAMVLDDVLFQVRPPGEAVIASSAGRHAVLAMLVPVELDETVLRRLHALLTV